MATRSADKRRTQARSKLNEALESSIEQNEKALLDADKQDKSSESENSDKETLNIKKEKEPTTAVNEIVSKQPRSPKAASSSYIMKLFDRSINLARYTEDTPLYVLSRNWMENSPRQLPVKQEKSSDAVMQVEEGDVVEIPKVRIRKGGKPVMHRKDVKINKKEFDSGIESDDWSKEKLLQFHRTRWEAEKKLQIENTRNFEEKHFAANLELLESLIKGNEE